MNNINIRNDIENELDLLKNVLSMYFELLETEEGDNNDSNLDFFDIIMEN